MNKVIQLPAAEAQVTQGEIIKLACLAVGGQGGGVLGNWIEAVSYTHLRAHET